MSSMYSMQNVWGVRGEGRVLDGHARAHSLPWFAPFSRVIFPTLWFDFKRMIRKIGRDCLLLNKIKDMVNIHQFILTFFFWRVLSAVPPRPPKSENNNEKDEENGTSYLYTTFLFRSSPGRTFSIARPS